MEKHNNPKDEYGSFNNWFGVEKQIAVKKYWLKASSEKSWEKRIHKLLDPQ